MILKPPDTYGAGINAWIPASTLIDTDGKLTLRVNGRLHHIGMGRTLARTPVLKLVQDLHVRIIHAATGELLRELTIDPDKDYQPTSHTRYPHQKRRPRTPMRVQGHSDLLRDHTVELRVAGFTR